MIESTWGGGQEKGREKREGKKREGRNEERAEEQRGNQIADCVPILLAMDALCIDVK